MFSHVVMDTGITEHMAAGLQSSGCGIRIFTQCTVGGAGSHPNSLGVWLKEYTTILYDCA